MGEMNDTSVFTDSLLASLNFFGDVFVRWIPASVTSLVMAANSSVPPEHPVGAWDLPTILADTNSVPVYESISHAWIKFAIITCTLSSFFWLMMIYSIVRVLQIRREERKAVEAAQAAGSVEETSKSTKRWHRIEEQAGSDDPNAWRLAVLEADIMLNELLDVRAYRGETMADKMKQVDRADFNTIDLAWEAHRYRNRIAHETAHAPLEHREVRRIISLYERVFREFDFIE